MAASSDANVAANWTAYTSNAKMYRGLATVLVGSSTGGTATTTWTDQDAVFSFDNTKGISLPGANSILNWGVKTGSGTTASGRNGVTCFLGASTTLNQHNSLYDCKIVVIGTNNFLSLTGDTSSEYAGCTFGLTGTGSVASFRVGSSGSATGSLYNNNFWANTTAGTGAVFSTFNATAAVGNYSGLNAAASFFRLTNATVFNLKDIVMNGSPSGADLIFVTTFPVGAIVRPKWSGATKLTGAGLTGSLPEAWGYDVIVTNASGTGVAGVTVKLTDALGNVVVNTTTDSNGRISYGSGITMNMVTVRDHVLTAGVYSARNRYPMLAEINGATLRYYHNWAVDGSGNFEDMVDAIPLAYAQNNPTTWQEASL